MNEIINILDTPELCDAFTKYHSDLAEQARRRSIKLRADAWDTNSDAEHEAIIALYAYEDCLRLKNGKKTSAARTRQMITRHGIIGAVERAVNNRDATAGYTMLKALQMKDLTWESIVVRYPHEFTDEALQISKTRLADWDKP